ncbi:glucose-6-phosphate isomerase [Endozoicomonas sp. SM1973]|uniref:Glucose-6-phosphate isomerase n=1 Tax=Spartinivicinus marinus TaxID=2994442 RepID=A0A853I9G3_9GAMM|nr:glucose-6-phosphate isomerase [Spartinivicinus marinus]MCX4026356.1 glucose-6-phosphate isomerase [Spartinivicinus marinus]NYZ67298.1 glucose-6-phosphate isomerase [Spartinivicinus marinus]
MINQSNRTISGVTPLSQYPSSEALLQEKQAIDQTNLKALFAEDSKRFEQFSLKAAGLFLDYSKNLMTPETLQLLGKLAEEAKLPEAIKRLFQGDKVNHTEQRPALHMALRKQDDEAIWVDGQDVMPEIKATLAKIATLTQQVHSGKWRGYTGKPITHIINIGIGGSFLGPKMIIEGLTPYIKPDIKHHYIANIDPNDVAEAFKHIDPETSLFIVASKSFSTIETKLNAETCRQWMLDQGAKAEDIAKHFLAVSSNVDKAVEFGIHPDNIYPMWDWVGGRYSLWSAIGLPIALTLGFDNFEALLKGAYQMDEHFRTAPITENMPALLGLIGVWYHNYHGATAHAVLPYDQYLSELPNHLQQVDMESNGKSVNHDGETLSYSSGPVIWGDTGTNGQHAYHQLLHQGTLLIPVDFVVPAQSHNDIGDHHPWLFANALSQSQALMAGKTLDEAKAELAEQGLSTEEIEKLAPHKVIPGNRPSNTILMSKVTPETLGALVALYEHKVFTQGMLWQVNSFDQWGVELGKQLGNTLFPKLKDTDSPLDQDSSTNGLISLFREINQGE